MGIILRQDRRQTNQENMRTSITTGNGLYAYRAKRAQDIYLQEKLRESADIKAEMVNAPKARYVDPMSGTELVLVNGSWTAVNPSWGTAVRKISSLTVTAKSVRQRLRRVTMRKASCREVSY